MTGPQKHQNRTKHEINWCRQVKEAQARQADYENYRQSTVRSLSKQGVDDVSAIQLSKGKQVQTCCKQTKPGCPADWMKINRRRISVKKLHTANLKSNGSPYWIKSPGCSGK